MPIEHAKPPSLGRPGIRGIETITLTEAHGEEEGLRTNRRKGSRDNLVEWTPRLQAAWDGALMLRRSIVAKRKQPERIRAEDRFVFLNEGAPAQVDSRHRLATADP